MDAYFTTLKNIIYLKKTWFELYHIQPNEIRRTPGSVQSNYPIFWKWR